jgi:hypothetical protein
VADSELLSELRRDLVLARGGTVLLIAYPSSRVLEIIAALEHMTGGAGLIAEERRRQVEAEGWTHEHDDGHASGELVQAARCYAWAAQVAENVPPAEWFGTDADGLVKLPRGANVQWPVGWDWKPDDDPVRNLVKAGALIAAEIDRLLRASLEST